MWTECVNIYLDQPEHHKKLTFTEEYELFIKHYQQNIERNKVIRF